MGKATRAPQGPPDRRSPRARCRCLPAPNTGGGEELDRRRRCPPRRARFGKACSGPGRRARHARETLPFVTHRKCGDSRRCTRMDTRMAQALVRFGLGRKGNGSPAGRSAGLARRATRRAGPGTGASPAPPCRKACLPSAEQRRPPRQSRRHAASDPHAVSRRGRPTRSPPQPRSASGWSGSGPTTSPSACAAANRRRRRRLHPRRHPSARHRPVRRHAARRDAPPRHADLSGQRRLRRARTARSACAATGA